MLALRSFPSQDVSKLNPLSPEVISRQATINIGTIGHVAHGKSTVVKAISGVQVRLWKKKRCCSWGVLYCAFLNCYWQTVRFKNELVRNITIKLGYANAKVRRTCLDWFGGRDVTLSPMHCSDLQVWQWTVSQAQLLPVRWEQQGRLFSLHSTRMYGKETVASSFWS